MGSLLILLVKMTPTGGDVFLPLSNDDLVASLVQFHHLDRVVRVYCQLVVEYPLLSVRWGHYDEWTLSGIPLEK